MTISLRLADKDTQLIKAYAAPRNDRIRTR